MIDHCAWPFNGVGLIRKPRLDAVHMDAGGHAGPASGPAFRGETETHKDLEVRRFLSAQASGLARTSLPCRCSRRTGSSSRWAPRAVEYSSPFLSLFTDRRSPQLVDRVMKRGRTARSAPRGGDPVGGLLAIEHPVPLRCREADRPPRGRRDGNCTTASRSSSGTTTWTWPTGKSSASSPP